MNESKKRSLSDRPMLSGFLSMILTELGSYGLALVLSLVPIIVMIKSGLLVIDDVRSLGVQVSNIIYAITPFLAVIWLYVFCRRNQKQGYLGAVKIRGKNCRDVWICISIFAAAFLVNFFYGPLTMPDGLKQIHFAPSMLLIPFCAGVSEEIVSRGIPVAVMMRGKPDTKRIRKIQLLTAVMFSLMHLMNGFGAGNTVAQLFTTLCMGIFWAALYLRTGSIVISIVMHFVYDLLLTMIVVPKPTPMVNIAFLITLPLLLMAFGFVLTRKSKKEEILEVWANIWSE